MIHGFEDVEEISIKYWFDMDHFDGGYKVLSDDEIISNITEKEYEVNQNTSEEEGEPSPCISH